MGVCDNGVSSLSYTVWIRFRRTHMGVKKNQDGVLNSNYNGVNQSWETRNTLSEKAVEVSAMSESATDHQESQWHKHSGANQTSQGKECL